MSRLARELTEPVLFKSFVRVNFKSPTEKISLLLVASPEVKSSFAFEKMLPEFVSEFFAEIVKLSAEKIRALAWLVMLSALMVEV